MPNCSKNREGAIAENTKEKISYICTSGRWMENGFVLDTIKTEDDLPNCTSKREGLIAYSDDTEQKFLCENGTWKEIDVKEDEDDKKDDSDNEKEETINSSSSKIEIIYSTLTDIRDGKTYKTVVIGTQTWMAENLNYADSTRAPGLKDNMESIRCLKD